ncbi:MAG: endonuclease [Desulfuromonas sp.]|nr:MAG: endonuclease [Desulfuromonas sp.]
MRYCVYILTNKPRGTLYTGVTSDLPKRIYQHKGKVIVGFSSKYDLSMLVYYEVFDDISEAIKREKQIKKWNRTWKIELIENNNPEWQDLYESII